MIPLHLSWVHSCKNQGLGLEMIQQLKALITLSEDMSSAFTTIHNSDFRACRGLFWSLQRPDMHIHTLGMHINAAKPLIYIKIK